MTFMDPSMFAMLFETLVHPHFEYAVALWNPRLMKHVVDHVKNIKGQMLGFMVILIHYAV